MPPKAAAKKGKKSGESRLGWQHFVDASGAPLALLPCAAGAADGSDIASTEVQNMMLKSQIEALKVQLGETGQYIRGQPAILAEPVLPALGTAQAMRAEKEKRALQAVVADLKSDFKETSDDTMAITSDMTRQYKAMEEHFMGDINALERQVQELKDELAESRVHYEELQAEKDAVVAAKDEELRALQAKMSDMAAEFAEMLQETLSRMADKIEISSSSWDAADASVPVLSRGGPAARGGAGAGPATEDA
ncbi:CCDC153 [Symbiodinium sp. KB8]|nr:CCDC153 [Symbiodinium sp. KB8]